MKSKGSDYYDNDEFFESYLLRRSRNDNPNDTIEKPILMELIGDLTSLRALDLGCGDARIGMEMMDNGCKSYLGIEGSKNMYQSAKENLKDLNNAEVINSSLEDWNFPENSFDMVISRLVIHYIEDIEALFKKVFDSLSTGGRFIFSIEHPVITSTLQPNGQRTNWIVDNYFYEGEREQQWLGSTVHKYHRTVETYFLVLQKVGFRIESLRESCPKRENFENEETYNRRMRIPLFLFLSCEK